jgi:hypothetical protein
MVMPPQRRSIADEAAAPSTPAAAATTSSRAAWKTLLLGRSLSRAQAIIGTLAGIASIGGAVISLVQYAHPATTGDLVAVVQAAGSRSAVTDATVEVLTPQNALVATLTPDATGRATHELKEGIYVVRVSHPKYAADVRRVQVLPRQTVEVRANLRAGSSTTSRLGSSLTTAIDRTVDKGVEAVRRALRF